MVIKKQILKIEGKVAELGLAWLPGLCLYPCPHRLLRGQRAVVASFSPWRKPAGRQLRALGT